MTRIRSLVSGSMCSEISVMPVLSSVRLNVHLFRRLGKRKCRLGFFLVLRCKIDVFWAAFFEALAEPERVKPRQVQQGQEGCNEQASHDGDGHRSPERGARQR